MRQITITLLATIIAGVLLSGCPMAPVPSDTWGRVSLIGPWSGSEEDVLMDMLVPFESSTGTTVSYTSTQNVISEVNLRIQAGERPEVVVFPNPGAIAEFAAQGELQDLSAVLDMVAIEAAYAQGWLDLGSVDGVLYAIFMKASMKGLIWYDTATKSQIGFDIPATWDELMTLSADIATDTALAPWTVGLESGAASGWPGTDWIESIMLKKYGPDIYNQWHEGTLAWTSTEVRSAWEEWGRIVADQEQLYGGSSYAVDTNYSEAIVPIYRPDPLAVFHHQGTFLSGFITAQFPSLEPGADYVAFPFPDIDPLYGESVIAAGDAVTMFTGTEQSRELMNYVATAEAQRYWLQRGAISPNKNVEVDEYGDPITQEAAQALTNADIVVFDASDLMPAELNNQFFAGVLDYVRNPADLDQILQDLEQVRQGAY